MMSERDTKIDSELQIILGQLEEVESAFAACRHSIFTLYNIIEFDIENSGANEN